MIILLVVTLPMTYLLTSVIGQAANSHQRLTALSLVEQWVEKLSNTTPEPDPSGPGPLVGQAEHMVTTTLAGVTYSVTAEYQWAVPQSSSVAAPPDLCLNPQVPQLLNLAVTAAWNPSESVVDTVNVDYPPVGVQTDGFVSLSVQGDTGATDALGATWSQRVQHVEVTFQPTGGGPAIGPVSPDAYGCVFAELTPGTYTATVSSPANDYVTNDFASSTAGPVLDPVIASTASPITVSEDAVTAVPTLEYDEGSTVNVQYSTTSAVEDGVTCPGEGDLGCVAAGVGNAGAELTSSTETGTPGTWTLDSGTGAAQQVSSLACAGGVQCVAVGYDTSGTGTSQGIALSDPPSGTTWTTDTIDDSGQPISGLTQAACAGTTACYAVGTGPSASSSATSLADVSGNGDTPTLESGATVAATGGPLGGPTIDLGSSGGWVETATQPPPPQTFTQLAWFNTTGPGGIMAFSVPQGTGGTTTHDRMVWVDAAGNVVAGVFPGTGGPTEEIASSGTDYADGQWNLVAVTLSSSGFDLYVNGVLAASNTSVTSAQSNNDGYWHLGWFGGGGWPDTTTSSGAAISDYLPGSLSGVAVLPTALSSGQISSLYAQASYGAYASTVQSFSPSAFWSVVQQTGAYLLSTPVSSSSLPTWVVDSAPAGINSLDDLTCPGAGACFVVGDTTNGPTILSTSGGAAPAWAADAIPAGLTAISSLTCPTATSCYAVASGSSGPVVLSTSGGTTPTWVADTLPTSITGVGQLACASAAACAATADTSSGPAIISLTTSTGTTPVWVSDTLPGGVAELADLTCPSTTACYATGATASAPVVLSAPGPLGTGPTWSEDTLPAALEAVSTVACTGSGSCYATGSTSSGSSTAPAIVSTTGGATPAWVADTLPSETTALGYFFGLACTSTTCSAVGSTANSAAILDLSSSTTWVDDTPPPSGSFTGDTVGGIPLSVSSANLGPDNPWLAYAPGTSGVNAVALPLLYPFSSGYSVAAADPTTTTTALAASPPKFCAAFNNAPAVPVAAQPGGTATADVPLALLPISVTANGVPVVGATITATPDGVNCADTNPFTLPPTGPTGSSTVELPVGSYSLQIAATGETTITQSIVVTTTSITVGTGTPVPLPAPLTEAMT